MKISGVGMCFIVKFQKGDVAKNECPRGWGEILIFGYLQSFHKVVGISVSLL